MNPIDFLEKMRSKIIPWENVREIRTRLAPGKLVFTNGCFDILHPGHVEYLSRARNLGDFLWVGLNSDTSVARLKGQDRPINSQVDRSIVLSALSSVDFITVFEEDTPFSLLQLLVPEIHCKGGDYSKESLPETPLVESWGGSVQILPFLPGKSTSLILKKAKQN